MLSLCDNKNECDDGIEGKECDEKRNPINKLNLSIAGSFLLFLLIATLIVITKTNFETRVVTKVPPRQTETQKAVWESVNEKAASVSHNATKELLKFFDSRRFRSDIANISSLANSSAQEILEVIQKIVLSSPVHHNFPLVARKSEVNLTVAMEQGYALNYFTAYAEKYIKFDSRLLVQNAAETKLMGFPEFSIPLSPNLTEAWTRPQYVSINIYGVAGGCHKYGKMSLVSKPSWVRNMTILLAVDTGIYTTACLNKSLLASGFQPLSYLDCSAWDGNMGTFNHFNHLLYANIRFNRMSFAWLLQRRINGANFNSPEYYGSRTMFSYLEGGVAGTLLFPQSVK